jgi:hypothetical protein
MFFLFSCSDSGTNPKDKDENTIPEGVYEFQSPQESYEFSKEAVTSIGYFSTKGLTVFNDDNSFKKTSDIIDSLYYKDGWWYYTSTGGYQDSITINIDISNKYQFSKAGTVQREWRTADKAHTIISVDFGYANDLMSASNKIESDLTYSELMSDTLIINGDGSYDMNMTINDTDKRFFLLYELKNLNIPKSGWTSGVIIVKTKKYVITYTFNGSNEASVVVTKDGTIVYSTTSEIHGYK